MAKAPQDSQADTPAVVDQAAASTDTPAVVDPTPVVELQAVVPSEPVTMVNLEGVEAGSTITMADGTVITNY